MISSCVISSAILLASIVARVITDPSARDLHDWLGPLSILFVLSIIRTTTHWLQAHLGHRGASAVIADLNGQVLASVTAQQPGGLVAQLDATAVVVSRGLNGLLPYFTEYPPPEFAAGHNPPPRDGHRDHALQHEIDCDRTDNTAVDTKFHSADRVDNDRTIGGGASRYNNPTSATVGSDLWYPRTMRALVRDQFPKHRIAELVADQRYSTMATLRIAFLSALVYELLATLGAALIAVGIGLNLVFGEIGLSFGLTVLLLVPDVY